MGETKNALALTLAMGATGSWNAAYDAISIQGAERVWIDRNTITDAPLTDDEDWVW